MPVSFDAKNIPVLQDTEVQGLSMRETRERLSDASKKLNELFGEYKTRDGKLDADEATAIKSINNNMESLKKRESELKAIEDALEAGKKEHELHTTPVARGGLFPDSREKRLEREPEQRLSVVTFGEAFTQSDAFKRFNPTERRSPVVTLGDEQDEKELIIVHGKAFGHPSVRRKTLMDTTVVPTQTDIGMITPDNRGLLPLQLPRLVIADLIPQANTNSNAISYMEETSFTTNISFVAEGGTKPESGVLAFDQKSVVVRKLATVLPVTEEFFEDAPAMEGYVNARLQRRMEEREETALLSGTGVAPEITGILNTSGIQTRAVAAGEPVPDTIYRAMVDLQVNALTQPTALVMNPLDWVDIRLLRTADGLYIWGNPSEPGPQQIWGLPVVSTTAIAQNTALMADFSGSMMIFRKKGITFSVSDQHADFFIKNQLMIRVEERFTLVVFRPAAIITITGV